MKETEIIIGWECNNNCLFCSNQYLREKAEALNIKRLNIGRIKNSLPSNNSDEVDALLLVGGEPTIARGFYSILDLARKKGYKKICIMSNGRMLSNIDFCKNIFAAGVTDIGISIHGHNSKINDYLTRSPGSFKQTIGALRNLNRLKKKFVTNTVINKKNYRYLPKLVTFLSQFKPRLILLTFPNPRGNAEKYFKTIFSSYTDVMPFVFEAIKIGKRLKQNIRTSDIPFCLMGKNKTKMQELFFNKERRIVTHVFKDIVYKKFEGRDKSKHRYCRKCKYEKRCEGVWTNYLRLVGDKEFEKIIKKTIL